MFENGRIFLSLVPKFGSANEQPYKYNAKEFDSMHGLNWYDYAARMYDPTSSRFTSIDPHAEKYYSISPYVYVMNNPLRFIDPDGKAVFLGGPPLTHGMSKMVVAAINHSDLQDAFIVGSAIVAGITGGTANRFSLNVDYTLGIPTSMNVNLIPVTGEDVSIAKSGLLLPAVSGNAVNKITKVITNTAEVGKAEQQVAKLSKVSREGKDFTTVGKKAVINLNKAKNGGATICENCATSTVTASQSKKGVTPPKNETQVDHVIPKSKGGSGTPDNGQVLCRDCNNKKSNN